MSFPAAECEAGAACATQTDNACRVSSPVKGEERQRPLTGERGRRSTSTRKRTGNANVGKEFGDRPTQHPRDADTERAPASRRPSCLTLGWGDGPSLHIKRGVR